jgi:hypothetical protein
MELVDTIDYLACKVAESVELVDTIDYLHAKEAKSMELVDTIDYLASYTYSFLAYRARTLLFSSEPEPAPTKKQRNGIRRYVVFLHASQPCMLIFCCK